MIKVTWTDHALQRWAERVGTRFNRQFATRLVLESRQATKSERRRRAMGTKTTHRLATAATKQACRVSDEAGLMFFVLIYSNNVTVKTVVKLEP